MPSLMRATLLHIYLIGNVSRFKVAGFGLISADDRVVWMECLKCSYQCNHCESPPTVSKIYILITSVLLYVYTSSRGIWIYLNTVVFSYMTVPISQCFIQ